MLLSPDFCWLTRRVVVIRMLHIFYTKFKTLPFITISIASHSSESNNLKILELKWKKRHCIVSRLSENEKNSGYTFPTYVKTKRGDVRNHLCIHEFCFSRSLQKL